MLLEERRRAVEQLQRRRTLAAALTYLREALQAPSRLDRATLTLAPVQASLVTRRRVVERPTVQR